MRPPRKLRNLLMFWPTLRRTPSSWWTSEPTAFWTRTRAVEAVADSCSAGGHQLGASTGCAGRGCRRSPRRGLGDAPRRRARCPARLVTGWCLWYSGHDDCYVWVESTDQGIGPAILARLLALLAGSALAKAGPVEVTEPAGSLFEASIEESRHWMGVISGYAPAAAKEGERTAMWSPGRALRGRTRSCLMPRFNRSVSPCASHCGWIRALAWVCRCRVAGRRRLAAPEVPPSLPEHSLPSAHDRL